MLISCASAGSASDPAAVSIKKNNTLRGNAGSLTKGSLDGRAGTPSRLRDFQTRSFAARVGAGVRCGRPAQAVFPAPPVARRVRPAGAGRLPAAAPFRPDSGPRSTGQGPVEGAAAAGGLPRVRGRGPAHEPSERHGPAAPRGWAAPRGRRCFAHGSGGVSRTGGTFPTGGALASSRCGRGISGSPRGMRGGAGSARPPPIDSG